MPLIGSMDVLTGLLVLFYPVRALLVWATVWTLWTALLRPLTGEGPWEFLERAGNYGVPIALLCLASRRIRSPAIAPKRPSVGCGVALMRAYRAAHGQ